MPPFDPMLVVPTARHVNTETLPWVTHPGFNAEIRILQASLDPDFYVIHSLFGPGLRVPTHRHLGPVHGWTMRGSWVYVENDWVATAGSYVYEPADSIHTLYVPEDNDGPTETIFVICGGIEYLDEDGAVIAVSNAPTMLQSYFDAVEAAGLPRPEGLIT
jgi:2,4'-dihydroxyacetophenone dioxygenase